VVRQIQDLRKATGLEVSDRIVVHLVGLDDLGETSSLASDVLAVSVDAVPGEGDGVTLELDDGRDARAWIERANYGVGYIWSRELDQ
jgi:hypothetical protein